jgi:hypothetical protein
MPFAGYKNFDDCTSKIMKKKGWGKKKASAYCAAIQQKVEGKKEIENIFEDFDAELDDEILKELISINEKGVPKKDGSGGGTRKNKGRGGCKDTEEKGKGKELINSCVESFMKMDDFLNDLSDQERRAVAEGRCENLIKSYDMNFTASFYEEELDENGSMFVYLRGITKDYTNLPLFKKFKDNFINTKVIWRHFHPANKASNVQSPIYGYIRGVEVDENEARIKVELYGMFDFQKNLQDFVRDTLKSNKPLGASFRLLTFGNKFIHTEELGITPIPKCDVCEIIQIDENEIKGEIMPDEDKDLGAIVLELETKLETKNTKITELESELNDRNNTINDLKQNLLEKEQEIDFLTNKKPKIESILEKLDADEEEKKGLATILTKLSDEELETMEKIYEKQAKKAFPKTEAVIDNNVKPEEVENEEKRIKKSLEFLGFE